MLEQKSIAVYLRISQEDLDMREGAIGGYLDKEESNSISNQRKLLQEYIVNNNEFSKMEIIEYLDDGYSATNFDRPGFISMTKLLFIHHWSIGKFETLEIYVLKHWEFLLTSV